MKQINRLYERQSDFFRLFVEIFIENLKKEKNSTLYEFLHYFNKLCLHFSARMGLRRVRFDVL